MFNKAMLLFIISTSAYATNVPWGTIKGELRNSKDTAMEAVTLTIESKIFNRTITVSNNFEFSQVPVGVYRLTASALGYKIIEIEDLDLRGGQILEKNLTFEEEVISLRDRVVAPSSFAILSKSETSTQYLDRNTVRRMPRLGDDIMRAMDTLPGTSSNDFGAAINIRGGEFREVLFQLDGMELIDPFHLKDYAGVFSFLDSEAIGGIELNTGGFDAGFGNAMSGVLKVDSSEPTENRSAAGASFGGLNFRTEGTFNNGLTSYVFSGRRGYLDLLLSFTADDEEEGAIEDQDVTYYDSFGKITHVFSPNTKASFHYLLANDKFVNFEIEDGEQEDVNSDYSDTYLWANLDTVVNDRLKGRTTIYNTSIDRDLFAMSQGDVSGDAYRISDKRETKMTGIKSHWEYATDRMFWRFGAEYRDGDADYNYQSNIVNGTVIGGVGQRDIQIALAPTGDETSAFVTSRFQINPKWIAEVGIRYDQQSLLDDSQVSPRLNVTYEPTDNHTFRFAYGVFHQAEKLHELQVADGVDQFSLPERATHYLLGYETNLPSAISLRAEAYYKDMEDLRTRYDNLTKSLVFYPGLSGDRVAIEAETGKSYGLELVLKKDLGQGLSWFVNYSYAKAEDTLADGRTVSRPWEQEHTLNLSANYRRGKKWNYNASWRYHTGWRTTPFSLQTIDGEPTIVPGDWYSDTYPAYHRLDLRVNRTVFTKGRKAFELFIDVTNLYNRKNQRGYESITIEDLDTSPRIEAFREDWLPILPSFGVNWRF